MVMQPFPFNLLSLTVFPSFCLDGNLSLVHLNYMWISQATLGTLFGFFFTTEAQPSLNFPRHFPFENLKARAFAPSCCVPYFYSSNKKGSSYRHCWWKRKAQGSAFAKPISDIMPPTHESGPSEQLRTLECIFSRGP